MVISNEEHFVHRVYQDHEQQHQYILILLLGHLKYQLRISELQS
jgi:hypothetical protein